jgi:anti-anti-sigma factor
LSLIQVTVVTGVAVAALPADVAIENVDVLHDELSGATSNQIEGLVLDLTETRFLDSAGIEMIFKLRDRLASRRQRLALVVPLSSHVRRVLELTGVDRVVMLAPDVASGVRAASDPAQGAPSPAG